MTAEYLLKWLDEKVREERGAVEIGVTDMENVGVWLPRDRENPSGYGDTVDEALSMAAMKDRPIEDDLPY